MAEIKTLHDKTVDIYPNTVDKAVTMTNGERLDVAMDKKANKTDIPTNVSELVNNAEYITKTTSALDNYYTKIVIDGKVIETKLVDTLPTENISYSTIYLLKVDGKDLRDAWMYINGFKQTPAIADKWEKIGSADDIDLSTYATKTWVGENYLALSGGTVTGETNFISGLTSNGEEVLVAGDITFINVEDVNISSTIVTDTATFISYMINNGYVIEGKSRSLRFNDSSTAIISEIDLSLTNTIAYTTCTESGFTIELLKSGKYYIYTSTTITRDTNWKELVFTGHTHVIADITDLNSGWQTILQAAPNYLSLSGGTVSGDTNFTGILQYKGKEVSTTGHKHEEYYNVTGGTISGSITITDNLTVGDVNIIEELNKKGSVDIVTPSKDGLMSKEDKVNHDELWDNRIGLQDSIDITGGTYHIVADRAIADEENVNIKDFYAKKIELSSKLSQLENDTNFITNTVNNLTNYYKKTETYTKEEINTMVGKIQMIVTEIPPINIPDDDIVLNSLYLYKVTLSDETTYTEQWIFNGHREESGELVGQWEYIGTTHVDLSEYVTKTELNTTIADFTTLEDVRNEITGTTKNYLPLSGGTMTGNIKGTSLILNATTEVQIKYNDTNSRSVVLNSTAFKPFDTASGNIDLGLSTARWKGIYGGLLNVTGTTTTGGLVITGTTATINANEIWHAGNDGSESGLDADLLDGKHASEFSSSSHTHSYLPATEDRDVKPNATGICTLKGIKPFFVNSINSGSGYSDLLVLDTYDNENGGKVNALEFNKSAARISHLQGTWSGTTWDTKETIAYLSDIPDIDTSNFLIKTGDTMTGTLNFDDNVDKIIETKGISLQVTDDGLLYLLGSNPKNNASIRFSPDLSAIASNTFLVIDSTGLGMNIQNDNFLGITKYSTDYYHYFNKKVSVIGDIYSNNHLVWHKGNLKIGGSNKVLDSCAVTSGAKVTKEYNLTENLNRYRTKTLTVSFDYKLTNARTGTANTDRSIVIDLSYINTSGVNVDCFVTKLFDPSLTGYNEEGRYSGQITLESDINELTTIEVINQIKNGTVTTSNIQVEIGTIETDFRPSYMDIPSNAKTADKLTTTRNLWGNNFDGTSDINGSIINSTETLLLSGEGSLYLRTDNDSTKEICFDGSNFRPNDCKLNLGNYNNPWDCISTRIIEVQNYCSVIGDIPFNVIHTTGSLAGLSIGKDNRSGEPGFHIIHTIDDATTHFGTGILDSETALPEVIAMQIRNNDCLVNFGDVPFVNNTEKLMLSSDIKDWAKATTKPTYSFNELTGVNDLPGGTTKYLRGDGTWQVVSGGKTYTSGTGININSSNVISLLSATSTTIGGVTTNQILNTKVLNASNADQLEGKNASEFSSSSHTHSYLPATDDRDVKPNTTGICTPQGIKPFFVTRINGGSGYSDLLVLDTYRDETGGKVNALEFNKNSTKISHLQGAWSGTTWDTMETIAYLSDIPDIDTSNFLIKTGDTMTGILNLSSRVNFTSDKIIQIRGQHSSGYNASMFYDSSGEETWGFIAQNIGTKFKFNTGLDGLNLGSGDVEGIADADLEIGNGYAKISGHTVWHAGNDGSGSGLDADMLDGYHGGSYIKKNEVNLMRTEYFSSGFDSTLTPNTVYYGDETIGYLTTTLPSNWSDDDMAIFRFETSDSADIGYFAFDNRIKDLNTAALYNESYFEIYIWGFRAILRSLPK